MKRVKGKLLIVVSLLVGWMLAYLRIPFIESNDSFFQGFIACIVCVLILLVFLWSQQLNPGKLLPKSIHNVLKLILFSIFLAAIFISYTLQQQNENLAVENVALNDKNESQALLIEAAKNSSQVLLLSNSLEELKNELTQNTERVVSNATIEALSVLSQSLKPYRYAVDDTSMSKVLSPERGRLLLTLIAMKIDSNSFAKIIQTVSFANADLRAVNMQGVNLEGINLERADMLDSKLEGINLARANLKEVNLWGSRLDKADLSKADLTNSDLGWASLNEVNLAFAQLSGADLTNVKLIGSDLHEARMKWVNLDGGQLIHANLFGADLFSASLIRTNFKQATMDYSRLSLAILNECILTDAGVHKIVVREGWLEKIESWNVEGRDEIIKGFEIIKEKPKRFQAENYVLGRIN